MMVNFTHVKKKGFLFLFLLSFCFVNAQESERYTQYLYNPIGINPASAGVRGVSSVFTSYRAQWVGVPGAPKTMMLSVSSPTKSKNLGLGFTVISDKIGPSDQSSVALDFSYSIKLNTDYKLSFGLKGSANLLNVDYNKLYLKDGSEPTFQTNIEDKFSPNVGVGLLFHSDKTSFGVSIPNLLETKFYDKYSSTASSSIAKENMNVFLTADRLFELSPSLVFKPALLVKVTKYGPLQTYVSSTFVIQQKFTLGMSYRFGGTINNLVGFQVSDGMFIGYGYDLETKSMRNYNTASHEVFVRFDLFPKNKK
jgi:type IX secretion system PorP/SprF family membrane protein